jgi:hypothetical protein
MSDKEAVLVLRFAMRNRETRFMFHVVFGSSSVPVSAREASVEVGCCVFLVQVWPAEVDVIETVGSGVGVLRVLRIGEGTIGS